jgi:type II secretory pathway component PulK
VVNAADVVVEAETEVAEVEDNMNMGDHRSRNQFHRNMDGGGAFCPCKKKVPVNRGFALVVVLWVVAIMGTITMMFTGQTRLSIKINHNSLESQRAGLLAEAGIHRLIAALVQDDLETISDHKQEIWFNSDTTFSDIPLGDGVYRLIHYNPDREDTSGESIYYGAMDECGKLNINYATRDQLLRLPNATEEIIDAIIDWRDEDDEPGTMGAESEYYQTLLEPYVAKNSLFDTLDELLIVKDVTLSVLYGEDTNLNGTLDPNEDDGETQLPLDNKDGILDVGWYPYITVYSYEKNVNSSGEARININTASEDELTEQLGDELEEEDIENIIEEREDNAFASVAHVLDANIDQEKWKAIVDRITVSDEEQFPGRININTAPKTVLQCLLPDDEDTVQSILEYRESKGTFDSIGDLLNVDGIDTNKLKQLANLICTRSAVFSVRSIGYIERSRAYREIYAVIDRGVRPPAIRYWKVLR